MWLLRLREVKSISQSLQWCIVTFLILPSGLAFFTCNSVLAKEDRNAHPHKGIWACVCVCKEEVENYVLYNIIYARKRTHCFHFAMKLLLLWKVKLDRNLLDYWGSAKISSSMWRMFRAGRARCLFSIYQSGDVGYTQQPRLCPVSTGHMLLLWLPDILYLI